MRTRLLHLWDALTSSYWFVPTAMLVAAAAAAVAMLHVDHGWTAPSQSAWIYTGGADGARSLLSTVAGSVITVAGVVFSITIAALVQASSQFGPRLLRNFMRDTGNQLVLGTFVATFIYCLLVLRAVRSPGDGPAGAAGPSPGVVAAGANAAGGGFVPNLSVTGAVVLAAGSLGVLVYFIDHVSRSLQAPVIVANIGRELERAVDRAYPAGLGTGGPPGPPAPAASHPVLADASGYLQAIDRNGLMGLATAGDLVLRLACRPGDYVLRGGPLLRVDGVAPPAPDVAAGLRRAFLVGRQRTAEQDLEYPVRQLVEVAVRALSPGINDPFTAVTCVDWLGAALAAAGRRGLPGPDRYDRAGRLRVVATVTTFDGLVAAALDQVRQYGRDSVAVTVRLLEVIAAAAAQLGDAGHRRALLAQADVILRQSRDGIPDAGDRADVQRRYDAVVAAVATATGGGG